MSPYVRTVRTASGARAGQIVYSFRKGARSIEHISSAHDDAELAVLKEVARQRLNAGQLSFDLLGLNSENDAGSAPQEPAGAGYVAYRLQPDGSAPGGPGGGLEGGGAGQTRWC